MIKRRDRHGRGVRGPLAQPNALTRTPLRFPGRRTAAEFFIEATTQSVQRLMQTTTAADGEKVFPVEPEILEIVRMTCHKQFGLHASLEQGHKLFLYFFV